jgi:glucose-fructose oxidoreductase
VTFWRKVPEYQGGFLLDGGVHMVAGLRLILGSTDHLTVVSAQTQQLQDYLPPVDTVDAVVQTKNGATGVISLSWGSDFNDNTFEFACEKGVVKMQFDTVTVNGVEHDIEFDGKGVVPEVAEFAKSIVNGLPVAKRQSPEEALADLEVLEQMLQSGKTQGDRMMLHFQV